MTDQYAELIRDIDAFAGKLRKRIRLLSHEKKAKFAELIDLLNESPQPPNVTIAFLMATLRRVYHLDQLQKAAFHLDELKTTLDQINVFPYSWQS